MRKKAYGKTNESILGSLSGNVHLKAEHKHLEIRSGGTGHVEAMGEARHEEKKGALRNTDF